MISGRHIRYTLTDTQTHRHTDRTNVKVLKVLMMIDDIEYCPAVYNLLTARAPSSTDYITVKADYITVTADYNLHTLSVVLPQADRSHWATNQLNQPPAGCMGFRVHEGNNN